jgi:hypothetical protein
MKKIKVKAAVLAVLLSLVIVSVVFGSEADGVERISAGRSFWNVEGSTIDPKIDGLSWIGAWERETKSKYTDYGCIAVGSASRRCNEPIYGGHVVFDRSHTRPRTSRHTVYILPICHSHNVYSNKNEMKTAEPITALKLKYYSGRY